MPPSSDPRQQLPGGQPPVRLARRPQFAWQLRTRALQLGVRTLLMGIVNTTPDSFSDGGLFFSTDQAVDHALELLDAGADMLDVGGESTRPGSPAATADAVGAEEELRRVLPVVEAILKERPEAIVSVDTYRASTARAAIEAGAEIVNDVSGLLWDAAMAASCAEMRCGVVLMHTRGLPSQWLQLEPLPQGDLVPVLLGDLWRRLLAAEGAGIAPERIAVDPGFGFGKRGAENWELLAQLSQLHQLGRPLVVGMSRKGFLAPDRPAFERDRQSHAAGVAALLGGAHVLRVHDVAGAREAVDVADEVMRSSSL